MSQSIATDAAVEAAKERIIARGENPTVERVRAEIGGGSATTISAALQRQDGKLSADADMEAGLQLIARQLRERGRSDRQAEIDVLNQQMSVALTERDAARQHAQETKDWLDQAAAEATTLRKKLQEVMESEREVTAKLLALQERHARCLTKVRRRSVKKQPSNTTPTTGAGK
jgi:chromosome segregation ATPase